MLGHAPGTFVFTLHGEPGVDEQVLGDITTIRGCWIRNIRLGQITSGDTPRDCNDACNGEQQRQGSSTFPDSEA